MARPLRDAVSRGIAPNYVGQLLAALEAEDRPAIDMSASKDAVTRARALGILPS